MDQPALSVQHAAKGGHRIEGSQIKVGGVRWCDRELSLRCSAAAPTYRGLRTEHEHLETPKRARQTASKTESETIAGAGDDGEDFPLKVGCDGIRVLLRGVSVSSGDNEFRRLY